MSRGVRLLYCVALAWLVPTAAFAQTAPPAPPSRLWFTAGVGYSTLLGHCQDCGLQFPYRHGGAVVGNAGYRVNPRMDAGADVFWIRWRSESGVIEGTALNAVVQFRPWESTGFFLKGGAGMVFIRNWVHTLGPDSDNSKGLSIVLGGGWVFQTSRRLGLQLFATERVGALGDLQTSAGMISDVTANFWTVGAAIVIR